MNTSSLVNVILLKNVYVNLDRNILSFRKNNTALLAMTIVNELSTLIPLYLAVEVRSKVDVKFMSFNIEPTP